MDKRWYNQKTSDIFKTLKISEHGLGQKEVDHRFIKYGPNKLPEAKVDSLLVIFMRQFESPLIYILLISSVVVFFMKEFIDGSIILFVLIFNAIIGTIQEGKARDTLLALKKFIKTNATVLRDGKEVVIPDSEVVPGDIIILQEGEKVPADARIIISNNLKIDESSLTGESEPIFKIVDILDKPKLSIAEQKNMVFKGTNIVAGSGKALVSATGINTVIGEISKKIVSQDTEVPLKANIRYLSNFIVIFVASIISGLFFWGVASGNSTKEMFTVAVSLAVSVIPEGLPIVMTVVLAAGVWRMSKRQALVKKLQAVEALGQAKVIAVDKTGTITSNELIVKTVYVGGRFFNVEGLGYEPEGDIHLDNNIVDPLNHEGLILAGKISAISSNAHVVFSEKNQNWRVYGDPTEAAMLVFADKVGFHKDELEQDSPKITEIPFDYKKKYHVTLHKIEDKKFLSVVGAPENILNICSKIWHYNKSFSITKDKKKELEDIFFNMSEKGLRVVALAKSSEFSEKLVHEKIKDLIFVGFLGMEDTLRPEVHEAMKRAHVAGIRVVMITGDHKVTARSIAQEAGIYKEGDNIITGEEIDDISDDGLSQALKNTSVFARVTPDHKLRIINAYKRNGEIIAMTGDGVNDAPSLVAANLGVAMGKIGTEVAKEASDIVLLDDNFGSIISAVEEGRNIYKTIKKVILYLFSTNIGELLTIMGALFLRLPLPILAAQIIWLNLVTDTFLDVSLGMEPKEKGLLKGKFDHPKKYIVDSLMIQRMLIMSVTMMVGTLYLFKGYAYTDITKGWTIALTTLAVFQWFNALNCRNEKKSIFKINFFSNKFLVAALGIVISLQILAIYNPFMQKILRTKPLSWAEWGIVIIVAFSIIVAEEIRKFFYRKYLKKVYN